MDFRRGMAVQAESDYGVYRLLLEQSQSRVARCHQLHYLQRATEKLAKAFLTKPGGAPDRSHLRFAQFLHLAKRIPSLRRTCRYDDPAQFAAYIRHILPAAERIERLAPRGSMENPNPEYPWRIAQAADVVVPCRHPFAEFDPRRDPVLRKLLLFVEDCFSCLRNERFDI